jgi:hypothetical protein
VLPLDSVVPGRSTLSGKLTVTSDGKVAVPLRRGSLLKGIKFGDPLAISKDDYVVMQTETGLPVVKFLRSPLPSTVTVSAEYRVDPGFLTSEHLLSAEKLEPAVIALRKAGIEKTANALEKEILEAKRHHRYVFASKIGAITHDSTKYTYSTERAPKLGSPSDPFYEVSQFRDEAQGDTCIQCNGARNIVYGTLAIHNGGEEGTYLRSASVFIPFLTANKPVIYKWSGAHATVQLIDANGSMEEIDGTPSEKDPRAPEAKKGFSFAWNAAGSLLPRFSTPGNQPPAPKVTPVAPVSPASSLSEKPSDPKPLDSHEKTPEATHATALAPAAVLPAMPRFSTGPVFSVQQPSDLASAKTELAPLPPQVSKAVAAAPPDPLAVIELEDTLVKAIDPDSLKKLNDALDELLRDPRMAEFRNSRDPATPVARVERVAHALRNYVQNKAGLETVAAALRAYTKNPALAIHQERAIPGALRAFAADIQSSLDRWKELSDKRQVRRYAVLADDEDPSFKNKVLAVAEAASSGKWMRVLPIKRSDLPPDEIPSCAKTFTFLARMSR